MLTFDAGGVGLNITGNVMVDRFVIERPGNVAIEITDPSSVDAEARARLRAWAEAGTGKVSANYHRSPS